MIDEDYRVWKVSHSYSTIQQRIYKLSHGDVTALDGAVATPHGFVVVSSEPYCSTFRFIWQGKEYRRTAHRAMSAKALAVHAGKFARFVAEPS